MNSKSIDLSYNIHYPWTVAGVGAGSIQVSVHFGLRCPFWVFRRMFHEHCSNNSGKPKMNIEPLTSQQR